MKRISEKSAKVLAAAQLRGDATNAEIAELCSYREHTVSYAMSRLESTAILRKYPFINVEKIGYSKFFVFLSVTPKSETEEKKFVRYLKESEEVFWLLEVGGDFQYGVGLCVRSIKGVSEFFQAIGKRFENIIVEKSFSSIVSQVIFGRKYLAPDVVLASPVSANKTEHDVEIDEVDRKVLSALSTQEYSSRRELARRIGMPPATFEYRVNKLRKSGVIVRFVYSIDCSAYDMHQYRLLLYSKGYHTDFKDELYRYCKRHKDIVALVNYFGAWDYDCRVEVARPADVMKIRRQLFDKFGDRLLTIKVIPQFNEIKFQMFPFSK